MRLSWICQEKNAPNGLIINKNIAKYHMQFSNRKLLILFKFWSKVKYIIIFLHSAQCCFPVRMQFSDGVMYARFGNFIFHGRGCSQPAAARWLAR